MVTALSLLIVALAVLGRVARNQVIEASAAYQAPKIAQERAQRQEWQRLSADADYQNAAFARGDLQTAVHGRYAPVIHSRWGYPE